MLTKLSTLIAVRGEVGQVPGRGSSCRGWHWQSTWQFTRFVCVGIVATGVQFALLVELVRFSICGSIAASSIGYGAGAVANYLLNFTFTFSSNNSHHFAIFRFMLVCAAAMMANGALMFLLVRELRMAAVLAQAICLAFITAFNFLVHRAWTYAA